MLSLNMKSGDYLTIDSNIVVQVFKGTGPALRVAVKAPKEIPIVRGAVLEREGEQRPEGLLDKRPQSPSDQLHSAKRLEKLNKLKAQREREEALRKQQAESQAAVTDALRLILNRVDSLNTDDAGVKEEIQSLRTMLDGLGGKEPADALAL